MTTEHHRATPEQWEAVQLHADPDAYCHRDSCILELHYRVEALEAAQQQAATEEYSAAQDDDPQVRRAIREPMEETALAPEVAPVATDKDLYLAYSRALGRGLRPALRAIYDLGRKHVAQPTPPTEPATVDARDPECVKRWPDCHSEGYDSRCCRFPKSCSCGGEPPAAQSAQSAQPAAQALVAAFDGRYENCFDDNWQELCIAAVLRHLAAAHGDPESFGAVRPEQLESMAAELEPQP